MSARPSDSRNEREILKFKNRREWRKWLSRSSSKSKGVWLAIKKKNSKIDGMRYLEAVEEAICYGWIDSTVRRLDEDCFIQWYSPRKEDSVWSLINKKRAIGLKKKGKMTKSGLRSVEAAKRNGKWQIAYSSRAPIDVPDNISRMLRSHGVLKKFNSLTQSQKLQYVYWIDQTKRQETRERRIDELIGRLRDGVHSM
jgi:uncharacterized protein YdeI (YjbR/CyaY-like superfamily)